MKTENKNRCCILNQTNPDLCIALIFLAFSVDLFLLAIFLGDIHHMNQLVFMTLVPDTKPFIIYLQNL